MIHPTAKISDQVIGNASRNTIIQLLVPCFDLIPSNSQLPKFRHFTSLYYLSFLIMWPFCLCCYEDRRVLISRWSLCFMRCMQYSQLLGNSWASYLTWWDLIVMLIFAVESVEMSSCFSGLISILCKSTCTLYSCYENDVCVLTSNNTGYCSYDYCFTVVIMYTVSRETPQRLLYISSLNIDRFSKFLHCYIQL